MSTNFGRIIILIGILITVPIFIAYSVGMLKRYIKLVGKNKGLKIAEILLLIAVLSFIFRVLTGIFVFTAITIICSVVSFIAWRTITLQMETNKDI